MVERGDLMRVAGGDLPVEAEERRKRKLLCMEDLRLALAMGDSYLGQTPIIAGSICNSRFLDAEGIEHVYADSSPALAKKSLTNGLSNGVNGTANGVHHIAGQVWNVDFGNAGGDPMQIDSEDLGLNWQGGSVQDVQELDSALDEVLNLADL